MLGIIALVVSEQEIPKRMSYICNFLLYEAASDDPPLWHGIWDQFRDNLPFQFPCHGFHRELYFNADLALHSSWIQQRAQANNTWNPLGMNRIHMDNWQVIWNLWIKGNVNNTLYSFIDLGCKYTWSAVTQIIYFEDWKMRRLKWPEVW